MGQDLHTLPQPWQGGRELALREQDRAKVARRHRVIGQMLQPCLQTGPCFWQVAAAQQHFHQFVKKLPVPLRGKAKGLAHPGQRIGTTVPAPQEARHIRPGPPCVNATTGDGLRICRLRRGEIVRFLGNAGLRRARHRIARGFQDGDIYRRAGLHHMPTRHQCLRQCHIIMGRPLDLDRAPGQPDGKVVTPAGTHDTGHPVQRTGMAAIAAQDLAEMPACRRRLPLRQQAQPLFDYVACLFRHGWHRPCLRVALKAATLGRN